MKTIAAMVVTVLMLSGALVAQEAGVTVRVRDIATYKGTGRNQLLGHGLVVGLNGTGDASDKEAAKMAKALAGAFVSTEGLEAKDFGNANIARVLVMVDVDESSTMSGARLTAHVSALGAAKSLSGGRLLPTTLRFDRDDKSEVIAEAGGLVRVSRAPGGTAKANENNGTTNASLVADLSREITFFETMHSADNQVRKTMTLLLIHPDSNTANAIADAINDDREILGLVGTNEEGDIQVIKVARAINPGVVEIEIPAKWHGSEMQFRKIVDNRSVNPDVVATVSINATTGVVVMTGNVKLLPGQVTAAGVTIVIGQDGKVPAKLPAGTEAVDPSVEVGKNSTAFQELLDTFNLLQLSAFEKAEVLKELHSAHLIQGNLVVESR